jgi:hypothetical protein
VARPVNAVIFAGPSVSPHVVAELLDGVCLPPVAQGDVYRAAALHPRAIGIVDGYFESVPSVWHKEILWAMSQGIHVFGSASMGALRAAELGAFGMIGVGAIFEAYRDGVIEDDDEVAVTIFDAFGGVGQPPSAAQGAAAGRYRNGSDAMVNIRATLSKAMAEKILSDISRTTLLQIAKHLFYPKRSYRRILELAGAQGVCRPELDALRLWLPTGAVDQKHDDAMAMLRTMREFLEGNPEPKRVCYQFEETNFWDAMRRSTRQSTSTDPNSPDAVVLRALARDPDRWARARSGALGWWFAAELARRDGGRLTAEAVLAQSAAFCHARGLSDATAVAEWLVQNDWTHEQLESVLERLAQGDCAQEIVGTDLEVFLLDYLRWTGEYASLVQDGRTVKIP